MKLTPLGNRILIQRVEEEEEITSGGIITPDLAREIARSGSRCGW